jgi:HEPN domain-containing protein
LAASKTLEETGFYPQACFQAEQAVEKALKALAFHWEGRADRVHPMAGTSGLLQIVIHRDASFEQYREDAGLLDQYYVPTRYPDALPEKAPYEVYSKRQAQEAVGKADRIVKHARRVIPGTA